MSSVFTRRIMGVETEYGITATAANGTHTLGAAEVARYLFEPIVDEHGSSNIFSANGSRLYLDMGAHPEIATAECDSITQLLNYERAGDRILDELAQRAEQKLVRDGVGKHVYLFKNNLDSHGNSYGCHENYLISRSMVLRAIGRALEPLMVTRQLICGAGLIEPETDEHPARFVLSQRADQVWEGVSSATTRARPMINSRDEAHADSQRYRRLHVIGGDTNLSEPTFALKVGSALLVLEMIEAERELPDFELADPIGQIREISRDLSGRTQLRLKNGGTVTALEIQQALCGHAADWLEVRDDYLDDAGHGGSTTSEMHRVVDLWRRALDALESQDFSQVNRELDWVIKKELFDHYRARLGDDWSHPKLAQIDLAMHDIRPGRGIFQVLQEKGRVERWTTDEAITAAMDTPPDTTRAHQRGKFLARARETETEFAVDWSRMKITEPARLEYTFGDPFATDSPELEELLALMNRGANDTE
ncbi:Pup--protein ligase [Corynebacterium propinquum]|uniref:Pup--protein ligase n=1 Tax=Corynebacterium propinquum TaxID=43769 RepID=UPI00266F005E|nr:Pup--protein ligase [Corynebacterium propinquum]WKS34448.1 Pup--protein ligase [Corynebacterium propinquum]WKS40745.1 Pup--protein ligase [Corynebacterium propinquum]